MPRVTRKSLAENAAEPSRSSPRASTKASSAAAGSTSTVVSKNRGRRSKVEPDSPEVAETKAKGHGKTESVSPQVTETKPRGRGKTEPESPQVTETKSRGRSASRGKAPAPAITRESRSRGRSSPAEKNAPTPSRKGRGKAKKEESKEEEEEEEEEKEEVQSTGRRSRGQTKSPATPASKTTPPARGSRSSQRSAQASEKVEEQEETKPSPKGGRGRGRSTSRSQRGRGAAKPEDEDLEEKETTEDATEKETLKDAEEKKTSEDVREEVTTKNIETEKLEEKETVENMEKKMPEDVKAETMKNIEEKKTEEDIEDRTTEKAEAQENKSDDTEKREESKLEVSPAIAKPAAPVSMEEEAAPPAVLPKNGAVDSIPSFPLKSADNSSSPHKADNPILLPSTKADSLTTSPPPKAGVKRKMEEDVMAETVDESDAKRARINGTETVKDETAEAVKDVAMETAEVATKETVQTDTTDVEMKAIPIVAEVKASTPKEETEELHDFVVVNKEEMPAPDSAEVAAAVAAAQPMAAKAVTMETEGSVVTTVSPTIIPLTEAELAKAYAKQIKAADRMESDEVSSTIVEVGSVGGSDGVTTMSRGLDFSELQSASNSIDGDFAADTSINEGEVTADSPDHQQSAVVPPAPQFSPVTSPALQSPTVVSPTSQVPATVSPATVSPAPQSTTVTSASPPAPETPVSQPNNTSTPISNLPPAAPAVATDQTPSSDPTPQSSTVVSPAPPCPIVPSSCQSAVPCVSSPSLPPAQGSGSVSENLGRPDPAFLAAHSSLGPLTRAYVPNPAVGDGTDPGSMFSIVSYNILAECNRTKGDYSYTPAEFQTQSYRHSLLMKELQYLNGDVVCMQEVNPDYFNTTLLPALQSLGYDGLLKRRTKEDFDEGEATFYRTSLFELETSKGVSLTEVAHKEVEQGGLSAEVGAAVNKYLDRADVVLITRLKLKATGKTVTIGNLHLVWDFMRCPDVQCIQVACAIKEVVGMAGSDGAHIICGDFNSEWSSPVYQLVIDGYLSDSSIHTLQAVQRLELNDGAKSLVNHLWRAFQHTSSNLKSAYSTVTKSEPEITTFTSFMKNAVDYIFYNASCLQSVGVLKTIDRAVIDATNGLPTKEFASDHLSMKAVMSFTK